MSESVLLALLGGIVGIFLAAFGLETLLALQPEGLPRADNIRLDGTKASRTHRRRRTPVRTRAPSVPHDADGEPAAPSPASDETA